MSALPHQTPVISVEEVSRATSLLEAFGADRMLLGELPESVRKAFLAACGKVANPERTITDRLAKRTRKKRRGEQREHDRLLRATTEIRTLRQVPVFAAPAMPKTLPAPGARPVRKLLQPRNCYVCKSAFDELHFFYDTMCPACAELNYEKRFATADLTGCVALITGARVKIGFQASLMMLRAGAEVIATTRFPQDAAERYSRESDFERWAHRLSVHGLDLRHAPSVEVFARHIAERHHRLDILINNAAQTVRRPPGFYGHLLPGELKGFNELSEKARSLLLPHRALLDVVHGDSALSPSWRSIDPALGIHASARLSLVPYAFENEGAVEQLFPQGEYDADLQQIDLRTVNTWRLKLGEVATAEMLEVHLVNAVAPFILCGKLRPLMEKHRERPGHVVNVSAMEGSFSRGTKTDKHPHTNMAKAALNMMTLTSAPDYAKSNIFMNAVDTGWVTDEDPAHHAQRKVEELDFQPPLDIVDGAARVVDPVFEAERTQVFRHGLFFKDYRTTNW